MVYFLDDTCGHIGSLQPTAIRHSLVMVRNLDSGLRPASTLSGRPL